MLYIYYISNHWFWFLIFFWSWETSHPSHLGRCLLISTTPNQVIMINIEFELVISQTMKNCNYHNNIYSSVSSRSLWWIDLWIVFITSEKLMSFPFDNFLSVNYPHPRKSSLVFESHAMIYIHPIRRFFCFLSIFLFMLTRLLVI